ncbi:unnamed protein product, partial [marine sediment metagenome]
MAGDSYDPKITIKKFLIGWATSLIGMIFPFTISYVNEYEWPAELLIYIPIVIASLIAFENAWKHWNKG